MLDQRRGEDHAELPHSFIIGCVRMLHRFRLVGGLAFCAVLLITGPILAIDPPEFTWPAVAMCAAIWVTAALALLLARRDRAPAAIHYLTISTDVALVSGIALMLGGSTSIMPIMYFIVVGATGLLLQRWPLLFAVLASIGALLGMDVMSDPRLTADDLIVWVVTLLVFGLATAGVISIGRRLAHQAVDRERERNEIRRTFGQHVSPQVVDALLNQRAKESASQDATVMFLDIRGFTTLSESRKPPEVVALLNQLFGFMIERINQHDGIINKFLGDGFMAAFGAPMSTGQDTRNAVAAAEGILDDLAERTADGRLPELRIGIGIHAGVVVTGNVGSQQRKEYTLIGDVVNVASRIEGLTKNLASNLLVSEAVWQRLDRPLDGVTVHEGVKVKGREGALRIYQLR